MSAANVLAGEKLKKLPPHKSYQCRDILFWGMIGALVFFIIYGFLPLDVTYDHWLMNGYVETDTTSHYAGWMSFRESAWSFPIGRIDGFGGTYATYMDTIPVVAILLKLFRDFLPETFQYFGIYILICFILQGISSGLLLSLFIKDKIITYWGVVLFCFSPIMIERAFRHSALASHWLILFALYFYFKARKEKKISFFFCLLSVLSIGIHPYFMLIMFALLFASLTELFLQERKSIIRSGIVFLSSLVTTVIWGYVIGALGTSSVLGSEGYGYFSLNLNAIINPVSTSGISWSRFLSVLPQTLGNYDGFNYLGLGALILLFLFFIALIAERKRVPHWLEENAVLILLSLGFIAFAISNVVTVNDYVCFEYPLPKQILSFAGIFRASARIFYPVYYIVMLLGINGVCLLWKNHWKHIVLPALILLQLIDLSPALIQKHESFNKDSIEITYQTGDFTGSKLWNSASVMCDRMRVLNFTLNYKLAAFGQKHHLEPEMPITSSHYTDDTDWDSIYKIGIFQIATGEMEKSTVYVTDSKDLVSLLVSNNNNVNVYKEDVFYLITSPDLKLDGMPEDLSNYTYPAD